MSIEEAVKAIRLNEGTRSQVISSIYHDTMLKGTVCKYVMNHQGSLDEALLVFNDMIVQFVKTGFSDHSSTLAGDLNPYLMGIAKYLWFAELKKKLASHYESFDMDIHQGVTMEEPESLFLTKERRKVLIELLSLLRSNCKDVLMHWANGFSMVEIAEKLNYQSEGMARKKKSQCFKELLDYLHAHPHLKDQLI